MDDKIQTNPPNGKVSVLKIPGEITSGDPQQQQQQQQQLPATYGPFHRVRSPTQSDETAQLQVQSQEIWGRPRLGSDIPQVQSYAGPLPDGQRGIEFYTNVSPDQSLPPGQARWTGPRPGVTVKDDFARISVVITKNTQIIKVSVSAVDESAEIAVHEQEETAVEEEDYVMVA